VRVVGGPGTTLPAGDIKDMLVFCLFMYILKVGVRLNTRVLVVRDVLAN
jgi:hypothetical protein